MVEKQTFLGHVWALDPFIFQKLLVHVSFLGSSVSFLVVSFVQGTLQAVHILVVFSIADHVGRCIHTTLPCWEPVVI